MVSRKRNKGQQRKAKKEETERNRVHNKWTRWARGVDENERKIVLCDHGCDVSIPDEPNHPVCKFMDEFFHFQMGDWWHTLRKHLRVWNNNNYREETIQILLKIGTHKLLGKNIADIDAETILSLEIVAKSILILENHSEKLSIDDVCCTRLAATKSRDIGHGNMRDILKFFSKRILCSCLSGMHSQTRKTLPKLGKCYHCKVEKERALLYVCSRCKIDQYCCRECQVAEWPEHQKHCDNLHIHNNMLKDKESDQDMD